nr:MAG TPA: hypothetical protein [Caudoviricetes sp.]
MGVDRIHRFAAVGAAQSGGRRSVLHRHHAVEYLDFPVGNGFCNADDLQSRRIGGGNGLSVAVKGHKIAGGNRRAGGNLIARKRVCSVQSVHKNFLS